MFRYRERVERNTVHQESELIEYHEKIEKALKEIKDMLSTMIYELATIRELLVFRNHVPPVVPPRKVGNKLGIYVDIQNMYYAAKDLGGKIDYKKLRDWIVAGRSLEVANAYVVLNPNIPDQDRFLRALEIYGFTVKTKVMKVFEDGNLKGDWDLGMAVDMIQNADTLDIIALVSGDGDFAPVVRLLQSRGVRVEVYSFLHNISHELKEAADYFYPLSEAFLLRETEKKDDSD